MILYYTVELGIDGAGENSTLNGQRCIRVYVIKENIPYLKTIINCSYSDDTQYMILQDLKGTKITGLKPL